MIDFEPSLPFRSSVDRSIRRFNDGFIEFRPDFVLSNPR